MLFRCRTHIGALIRHFVQFHIDDMFLWLHCYKLNYITQIYSANSTNKHNDHAIYNVSCWGKKGYKR